METLMGEMSVSVQRGRSRLLARCDIAFGIFGLAVAAGGAIHVR